tara:strand:- start:1737 stop:1907 length:171 start_codon:yes stop_codon:yes gene_type:complete
MKVTAGELKSYKHPLDAQPVLVVCIETRYGYGWVNVMEIATGNKRRVKVVRLREIG